MFLIQSKRSRSKDRHRSKRHRHSASRSRSRSRERSRERERRRERERERNDSGGDRKEEQRGGERQRQTSESEKAPSEPLPGHMYSGKVSSIMQFGAFVQLEGLRAGGRRWEGLVHISHLRAEGRVTNVSDVVRRGQAVRVKVLSVGANRVSLSMREVDQSTGEDLNPEHTRQLLGIVDEPGAPQDELERARNPERPSGNNRLLEAMGIGAAGIGGGGEKERRATKRVASPELWELKQMGAANVLDKSELPDFDPQTGLLPKSDDDSGASQLCVSARVSHAPDLWAHTSEISADCCFCHYAVKRGHLTLERLSWTSFLAANSPHSRLEHSSCPTRIFACRLGRTQ